MHSARVVILKSSNDPAFPGMFACDADSECGVLPLESLGIRLDTPDCNVKRGIDGVKIILPEAQFFGM